MIEARIILDSINTAGNRITSWVLTYPRFIHSEIMTHRMFSRNAASSRAIPVEKMIKAVQDNPAMPVYWGLNKRGMQATEELDKQAQEQAKMLWLNARDAAVQQALTLHDLGLHKQVVNRVLEPFTHMTVILTATEYGNFFALRAHPDAQPEFQALAYLMLQEYMKSTPILLRPGSWHIPFGDNMPEGLTEEQMLKIATARCARVSYLTFDGKIDPEKDYELHDSLKESGHFSPFEHSAYAAPGSPQVGNFVGFIQYRKLLRGENRVDSRLVPPPPHQD